LPKTQVMITLKEIVSSNLEMLKMQEASLLKSLEFIQKARQLFESQSNGTEKNPEEKRRRRSKKKRSAAKAGRSKSGKTTVSRGPEGSSRLTQIMEVLQTKKGPISSGELLNELFGKQTSDKDKKHFRTLFYPVLTKAYKTGDLKLKNKKIHIGSTSKPDKA
jgi:hypothetical protein